MAYMNADTSAKVGFRPYLQTDAFGAAHLSGYGSGEKKPLHWIDEDVMHPFRPEAWHLHGMDGAFLGTYHLNRPFDPWELYPDVHHTAGVHLGGLGYMGGAVDPSTTAELVANGYDQNAINTLIANGATNDQLLTLPYPADPSEMSAAVSDLANHLAASRAPAAPISSAGVPAGTELLYNVAWATKTLATQTPQDIAAAVASALAAKWGINVVSSTATANFFINQPGFSLHVRNNVDYGQPDDIRSIIDGEVYNAGRQVVSSSISIVHQAPDVVSATRQNLLEQLAAAQKRGDTVTAQTLSKELASLDAATIPGGAGDFSAWFMINAKWIGLLGLGIVVAGPVASGLFGRRR